MTISLANLKPAPGSRTRTRRIGRGPGSGRGTTAGRGTKGQRARSGGRKGLVRLGLKRIMQRIPKHRGGVASLYKKLAVVNVGVLNERCLMGSVITPAFLKAQGIVRTVRHGVKILAEGNVTKALTVKGCEVSQTAREKIEKAGGHIEI